MDPPSPGFEQEAREIRGGLDRHEFELHYQPQIDLDTGAPIGVEALLRWRRGDQLVSPAGFLAVAEAADLMGPLTERVLELAVSDAAGWTRAGDLSRVAVNLSAANLTDFAVVRYLEALLAEHGVPGELIVAEVTETAFLREPERARAVLDALARMGVSISLDDFGLGYSSLLWLRLFPVSEVKVDRSLISTWDQGGEPFASGVIRLGQDLGLRVVAEGVEEVSTLHRLQELRCDLAQGLLFSRPLEAEALGRWLRDEGNRWPPIRREVTLDPDPASLERARELVGGLATELGYDSEAIWEVKLAATEALMNAIEHGTPGEDGMVHMRLAAEGGSLLLEIWGGNRERTAPVHSSSRGRGITIMTALMDEVELKRSPEDSRVRLTKRRRSRARVDPAPTSGRGERRSGE